MNDAVRPKLQDVLNSAQLSPVYDESGQFGGVKLTNIRPGGAFTGMPENSVCFELNGAKLDGVQRLPQALLSMGDGADLPEVPPARRHGDAAMPVARATRARARARALAGARSRPLAQEARAARRRGRWSRSTSRTPTSPR